MAKLKYAGLCTAGIALNVACSTLCLFLIMQVFLGNPYEFIPYLIGLVLGIAAGFVHVLLMNIIRKKLEKRAFGYALAVFVVPMGLAILGVIVPFAAVSMGFGDRLSMFLYSFSILPVIIVSGISTLCFSQHFGVLDTAFDNEENSPTMNPTLTEIKADLPEEK